MVVRGFWLVRAETRRVGVNLVGERSGGAGSLGRIGRVHRAPAVERFVDSDLGRVAESTWVCVVQALGNGAAAGRSLRLVVSAAWQVARC